MQGRFYSMNTGIGKKTLLHRSIQCISIMHYYKCYTCNCITIGWLLMVLLHLHLVQTHEVLLVGGVQLGSVLALVGPVPRSGHRVVVVVLVRGKDNGAGPPVLHWECGAWVQQGAG